MSDGDCTDEAVCKRVAEFFCSSDSVDALWTAFRAEYTVVKGAMAPEELRGPYHEQRHLTLDQLLALMRWKARARSQWRVQRNSADRVVEITREIAEKASSGSKPSDLFSIADALEGIHIPSTSAILASWDETFPIMDIRAWRAIFRITRCGDFDRGQRTLFTAKEFDRYVKIVRCASAMLGRSPRRLDVALYMLGGRL